MRMGMAGLLDVSGNQSFMSLLTSWSTGSSDHSQLRSWNGPMLATPIRRELSLLILRRSVTFTTRKSLVAMGRVSVLSKSGAEFTGA